jgi:hypothetical protein
MGVIKKSELFKNTLKTFLPLTVGPELCGLPPEEEGGAHVLHARGFVLSFTNDDILKRRYSPKL